MVLECSWYTKTPKKQHHRAPSTKSGTPSHKSSMHLHQCLVMEKSSWRNGTSRMSSGDLIAQKVRNGTLLTCCRYQDRQVPSLLFLIPSNWDGSSTPYFCTASETACKVAVQYIKTPWGIHKNNKFLAYTQSMGHYATLPAAAAPPMDIPQPSPSRF